MQNLKNKVHLIGNLGMDPEVKKLENGNSLAKFSLATSDSYKNKDGEKVEETQWHNLVAWGPKAEFAEKYLKKGSQVYVEGKLQTRSWEDKDGNTRYTTEIVGNNLTMLGKRNEGESDAPAPTPQREQKSAPESSNQTSSKESTSNSSEEDDDLPF